MASDLAAMFWRMFSWCPRVVACALLISICLVGCGPDSTGASGGSTTTTEDISTTVPGGPIGTLQWSTIASTVKPGLEATGGAVNGKLYSFGGYYDNTYVATNVSAVYDPKADTWEALPNVPRPVTHTGTVIAGHNVIIAGGNSTNAAGARVEAINNVFEFNTDTGAWSNLPDLPGQRAGGGMAIVGSVLHYFGGVDITRTEQPTHWTLDLNDLAAGWKVASTFPYPRTHMAITAIGTKIYLMGGLVGIDQNSKDFGDTLQYDTSTNKWTKLADMPSTLSHASDATVIYNGRIWMFGGETGYNVTQTEAYVYDPTTNQWSRNTNLPEPRFAGIAGNIDGIFYFARGSMTSNVAWKAKLDYGSAG